MEKYTKAQTDLRKEIEKAEQETINTTMEKIIQEGGGGVKGNRFWKIRKNIMRTNNQYEYIAEYIAEYYENLYQAREGKINIKNGQKVYKQKQMN